MAVKVKKRDGSIVDFQSSKIKEAINKAFAEFDRKLENNNVMTYILLGISSFLNRTESDTINVENIQDIVEDTLLDFGYREEAKTYIRYRHKRELVRKANTTDMSIKELLDGKSEYWNKENSNKNSKWITTQRDYIAGITSKDIARRFIFPKDVIEAHDKGIIHIHDMDYMAQNTMNNCCLINLNDMLQNGTVINGVAIDKPHRLITATTIATQIIAAVSSSEYGGCTITMTHLAPFVKDSMNYYLNKYKKWGEPEEKAYEHAMLDLKKEVSDSIQTLNYQLNSLTTTNGQSPFVSLCLYLGETNDYKEELAMLIQEILEQRILGVKNKVGAYVTQAFPKLLYVLEEDNIHEDSEYWYLTELAAKCTAKRMVPDYISEKVMKELKLSKGETPGSGDCYPCMGCRSFLTPDRSGNGYNNIAKAKDYDGKPKYYGRFNIGVTTINLADVALSSNGDIDKFWELMEERTELCHKVQKIRADRLCKTKAEVAPILWCDGAFARLSSDDYLEPLIHGGFCTSSLGFCALYECVKYMTGCSHTQQIGHDFGIQVMEFLNKKTEQWKQEENIDYSLYGSPIESGTYKFASCLQKRFGEIEGITDRDYVTNSYHVPVFEKIDIFSKFIIESEFQKLSPGGAISYGETSNLQNNIPAVLEVIKFIYNHIMYAELNTKSDYCQKCGYNGEIVIKEQDKHHHYFECPNCGNMDEDSMNIARRVCGYISTNGMNEGRMQDVFNRFVHIDDIDVRELE